MQLSRTNIFLLDGIGAFISAISLGMILPLLQTYIGLDKRILYMLAAIAILFACYSLCVHYLKPKKWRRFLKIIIGANISYGLLTLSLVLYKYQTVGPIGKLYFVLELIILTLIICLEINVLRDK